MKLSLYIDRKKQQMVECRESIVQSRQASGQLEEDVRLARREKDLTLSKQQQQIDELKTRVK